MCRAQAVTESRAMASHYTGWVEKIPELTSGSKNQTFKNPKWRTAAILNIVRCDISETF